MDDEYLTISKARQGKVRQGSNGSWLVGKCYERIPIN